MVLVSTSEGGLGMKILVIDDDVLVARALQRGLRDHAVTVEHDGRSAIAIVARALLDGVPFDLVICDLTMPDMSGREVLAQLRTQRDPPMLVLLSGSDTSNDTDVVADGTLMKPCRTAEILDLVAEIRDARSKARTQPIPCNRAVA
jgi:DNA-binding response OmpR family regulator